MRRARIQTEILLSLGLVMVLATLVVAGVHAVHHELALRRLLGRALLGETRHAGIPAAGIVPHTQWWELGPRSEVAERLRARGSLDPEGLALALEARRRGKALLHPGAVWEAVRFAAPTPGGGVRVARIPEGISRRMRMAPLVVLAGVLVVDVLIFTALGAALLRRRVVQPLRELVTAAGEVAAGATGTRVAERGARETAELARSFNTMNESLERRTEALRKAVVELRASNSELRRTRAGLDRAEQLAAVGRLAAGVAHEVGNPMGAMLAFLDLVGRDPQLQAGTRDHLAKAVREGERVRGILRQLLDFARPQRGERVELDLVRAAEETLGLVCAQRRYATVRFDLTVEGTPPLVRADPGAITQILLNLLLNAADAVVQAGGGRVRICVRPAHPVALRRDDPEGETPTGRMPEASECVIADQGAGIPREDRERIFLPFVTSKPPGDGTGLGLPNALRLAEEQGGALDLEPAPQGFATAFVLRLPAAGEKGGGVRGDGRGGAAACGV